MTMLVFSSARVPAQCNREDNTAPNFGNQRGEKSTETYLLAPSCPGLARDRRPVIFPNIGDCCRERDFDSYLTNFKAYHISPCWRDFLLSCFSANRKSFVRGACQRHDCGFHLGSMVHQVRALRGCNQQVPLPHHLKHRERNSKKEFHHK